MDFFAFMGASVIEYHDDVISQMLQEVAKKLADFWSLNVFAVQLEVEAESAP